MINRLKKILYQILEYMNPVFIKELRKSFRGIYFYMALYAMLLLFLAQSYYLESLAMPTFQLQQEFGTKLFLSSLLILGVTVTVIVPLKMSSTLISSEETDGTSLIYTTTMKPYAIILGKFYLGLSYIILVISMVSPFLACYCFLGKINIIHGLLTVLTLVCLSCPIIALVVLNSVGPAKPLLKKLRMLIVLALVNYFIYTELKPFVNSLSYYMGHSTIVQNVSFIDFIANFIDGGMYGTRQLNLFFYLVILSIVTGLFLFTSQFVIAPKYANRSLPLRIFTGLSILVWTVGVSIYCTYSPSRAAEVMVLTAKLILSLYAYTTCILINENKTVSIRIKNELPNNKYLAVLKYPFTSGAVSGLWFCAIIGVFAFIVPVVMNYWFNSGRHYEWDSDFIKTVRGAFIHVFIFAILGYVACHRYFKQKFPKVKAVYCALFIILIVNVLMVTIMNYSGFGHNDVKRILILFLQAHDSTTGVIFFTAAFLFLLCSIPMEINKFKYVENE